MPKNSKSTPVAPVAEPTPVVEAAPVEVKVKKSTRKTAAAPEVAPAPVVVAAPVVEEPKTKRTKKTAEPAATPVVDATETATTETPAQEGGKRRIRYFRCIYPVVEGAESTEDSFGRFSGYKPKQAAGKALTSILRNREKEGKDIFEEVSFSMIECTRGGAHKVSQYVGKRVKLEKPVVVSIKTADDKKKEITYNFTNKITKVKTEKPARSTKPKKATSTKKKTASKKKTTKKTTKAAKKATKTETATA